MASQAEPCFILVTAPPARSLPWNSHQNSCLVHKVSHGQKVLPASLSFGWHLDGVFPAEESQGPQLLIPLLTSDHLPPSGMHGPGPPPVPQGGKELGGMIWMLFNAFAWVVLFFENRTPGFRSERQIYSLPGSPFLKQWRPDLPPPCWLAWTKFSPLGYSSQPPSHPPTPPGPQRLGVVNTSDGSFSPLDKIHLVATLHNSLPYNHF